MENHPLSRSTRQTRSALFAVSVAAISFVFFVKDGSEINSPLLGVTMTEQFAPIFFVAAPIYLIISFLFAASDDTFNIQTSEFVEGQEAERKFRAKIQIENIQKRLVQEIRKHIYHDSPSESSTKEDPFEVFDEFAVFEKVSHISKSGLPSAIETFSNGIIEFIREIMTLYPQDDALKIPPHELQKKFTRPNSNPFELDIEQIELLVGAAFRNYKLEFSEILSLENLAGPPEKRYKVFRQVRAYGLEIGAPVIAGLAAIGVTLACT